MAYYRQLESGKWLARVWIPQEMDVDDHQPSKTFDLKRDAKAWAKKSTATHKQKSLTNGLSRY